MAVCCERRLRHPRRSSGVACAAVPARLLDTPAARGRRTAGPLASSCARPPLPRATTAAAFGESRRSKTRCCFSPASAACAASLAGLLRSRTADAFAWARRRSSSPGSSTSTPSSLSSSEITRKVPPPPQARGVRFDCGPLIDLVAPSLATDHPLDVLLPARPGPMPMPRPPPHQSTPCHAR